MSLSMAYAADWSVREVLWDRQLHAPPSFVALSAVATEPIVESATLLPLASNALSSAIAGMYVIQELPMQLDG